MDDEILRLAFFMENQIESLYTDIEGLMTRYGTMDIGSIDIAALLTELIEIMSANELAMPAQLTLRKRNGVVRCNCRFKPQVNIIVGGSVPYFPHHFGKM